MKLDRHKVVKHQNHTSGQHEHHITTHKQQMTNITPYLCATQISLCDVVIILTCNLIHTIYDGFQNLYHNPVEIYGRFN